MIVLFSVSIIDCFNREINFNVCFSVVKIYITKKKIFIFTEHDIYKFKSRFSLFEN
jgi:hypothetical protein